MTGMDHAIERAAQVLAANWRNMHTNESLGQQRMLARALADAGLLAPGMRPTRTWRAVAPEGHIWCESSSEAEVRRHARPGDIVERLWATAVREEWRAEGDGRDEREPTVPASQLRAFARLCVDSGDMTPAAARMLDRIIDGDGRAEG